MSEWITDRRPTKQDAPNGHVCIAHDDTITVIKRFDTIELGTPWKPVMLLELIESTNYTDYLRAEVERLTKLCSKYERTINALQEAGVIS